MKSLVRLMGVLGTVALLTNGCAINRATALVDPATKLSDLKMMYVQKIPEESRGINVLIVDKLATKGVKATTGEGPPPEGIDAVVSYIDRWMWDITMYMIELTITIRDPKTDFPLATGNSFHTSLTRLSPKEMVSEVIDNIYKEAK